ncbi:MAG TPA: lycopene cyclase domain-containing protein [Acidimicrobiales bacterium]|nr:lycopene cyclase domain-containing protein [Acidimicrobiales bacterium]
MYTLWAAAAVVVVVLIELLWARTGIFRRVSYWVTLAVVWAFQIPVDGWLTKLSAPIVIYNRADIVGWRVVLGIPVEDFGYSFALVTLVLVLWLRQREPEEPGEGEPG